MLYKILNGIAPDYLQSLFVPFITKSSEYNFRHGNKIKLPLARLESYRRSFVPSSILLWNNILDKIKNESILNVVGTVNVDGKSYLVSSPIVLILNVWA